MSPGRADNQADGRTSSAQDLWDQPEHTGAWRGARSAACAWDLSPASQATRRARVGHRGQGRTGVGGPICRCWALSAACLDVSTCSFPQRPPMAAAARPLAALSAPCSAGPSLRHTIQEHSPAWEDKPLPQQAWHGLSSPPSPNLSPCHCPHRCCVALPWTLRSARFCLH